MLNLSQTLTYYKRRDVMKLILEYAANKEIGVRYNEAFGKRPDVINYEDDILSNVKNGATSFHCSEELWSNPLRLDAAMRRKDLDDLRIGWDLILDVDCPFWIPAKLITYIFIKALKDHGIKSVSVKFSGGKGFHIAVPFEAFPKTVNTFNDQTKRVEAVDVKNLFPEGPRKIAEYLLYYAENNLIIADFETKKVQFGKVSIPFTKLAELTGKQDSELIIRSCKKCNSLIKPEGEKLNEFICPHCETTVADPKNFLKCPKCGKIMQRMDSKKSLCKCGSNEYVTKIDLHKIVDVDTVLISSRHLYRMPYSLHEKSGLVSIPFDIKHVLEFEKEEGLPSKIKISKFMDRSSVTPGEATQLFQKAFDYQQKGLNDPIKSKRAITNSMSVSQTMELQEAIPEEFFPPCIKKILLGLEDGKKRALFILINFLQSCNWPPEKIEEYIMAWNERNHPDQIRETYIRGQLRYAKTQKEKLPPPNCNNRGYMTDTGFCNPDGLCRSIKNPLQYAKKKAYLNSVNAPKKRRKKEE